MACSINLRSDALDGADGGGTWTYIGYNATNENGPYSAPPNIVLPAGDDPLFDSTGQANGFYAFRYELAGCGATITIIEIIDGPGNWRGGNNDVCLDSPEVVDLYGLLAPNPDPVVLGGIFTPITPIPAGSLNGNLFDTSSVGVPSVFTFVYTVAATGNTFDLHSDANCQDCIRQENVSVTVEECCDCSNTTALRVGRLHSDEYIYRKVVLDGLSFRYRFDSIKVAGVEYLPTPQLFEITPGNINHTFTPDGQCCGGLDENENCIIPGGTVIVTNIDESFEQLRCQFDIPMAYFWFSTTDCRTSPNGFSCVLSNIYVQSCNGQADFEIIMSCLPDSPGYATTYGTRMTQSGITRKSVYSGDPFSSCTPIVIPTSDGCVMPIPDVTFFDGAQPIAPVGTLCDLICP